MLMFLSVCNTQVRQKLVKGISSVGILHMNLYIFVLLHIPNANVEAKILGQKGTLNWIFFLPPPPGLTPLNKSVT